MKTKKIKAKDIRVGDTIYCTKETPRIPGSFTVRKIEARGKYTIQITTTRDSVINILGIHHFYLRLPEEELRRTNFPTIEDTRIHMRKTASDNLQAVRYMETLFAVIAAGQDPEIMALPGKDMPEFTKAVKDIINAMDVIGECRANMNYLRGEGYRTESEKVRYMEAVLTNDEESTDLELVALFRKELKMSQVDAENTVSQRKDYLKQ